MGFNNKKPYSNEIVESLLSKMVLRSHWVTLPPKYSEFLFVSEGLSASGTNGCVPFCGLPIYMKMRTTDADAILADFVIFAW